MTDFHQKSDGKIAPITRQVVFISHDDVTAAAAAADSNRRQLASSLGRLLKPADKLTYKVIPA